MIKTGNMENYSMQRGSREGEMSLMSQIGECGANLVQRNKIRWETTSKGASG